MIIFQLLLSGYVIYEIEYEGQINGDSKYDIYRKYEDEDRSVELVKKIRYFKKYPFLVRLIQYKHEWKFKYDFKENIVIPNNVTHLDLKWWLNQKITIPNSVKYLELDWYSSTCLDIPDSVNVVFEDFISKQL